MYVIHFAFAVQTKNRNDTAFAVRGRELNVYDSFTVESQVATHWTPNLSAETSLHH